jgi:hypothetical protein
MKSEKPMQKTKAKDTARQRRIENFERVRAQMAAEGYSETLCTISIIKANIVGVLVFVAATALFVGLYALIWQEVTIASGPVGALGFILAFVAMIPLHEALHGLTWSLFCAQGYKSINYGMIWKYLAPYCSCLEPLGFGPYLLGGLMPFLVFGIGLYVVALVLQSVPLLVLSIFGAAAASGDLMIVFLLLRHRRARVMDHPTEGGFIAFEKQAEGPPRPEGGTA